MKISPLSMSLGLALTLAACTNVEDDASGTELRSCDAMIAAAHEAELSDLPSITAQMADEGCYDLDLARELGLRALSEPMDEADAEDLVESLRSLQSVAPHQSNGFRDAACTASGSTCIILIGGGGTCVGGTIGGTTIYVCGPAGAAK